MRQVRAGSLFALWLAIAAVGCNDAAQCGDSQTPCASAPSERFESFESDLPPGTAEAAKGDNDTAATSGASASRTAATPVVSTASAEVAREIAEADIIQLRGDRLFALSRAAGLAVIDVSDPKRAQAARASSRVAGNALRDVLERRCRAGDVYGLGPVRCAGGWLV